MGFFFPFSSFLFITPLLDRCLQNVITPLYGPVWVFKREGFSLSGAKIYIQGVLLALHQRLQSLANRWVVPLFKILLVCFYFQIYWLCKANAWHCCVFATYSGAYWRAAVPVRRTKCLSCNCRAHNRGVNCVSVVVWDVMCCIVPPVEILLKPSVLTAVLHRQLLIVS